MYDEVNVVIYRRPGSDVVRKFLEQVNRKFGNGKQVMVNEPQARVVYQSARGRRGSAQACLRSGVCAILSRAMEQNAPNSDRRFVVAFSRVVVDVYVIAWSPWSYSCSCSVRR